MHISNSPPQRQVDRLALDINSSSATIPLWKAYAMARLRLGIPKRLPSLSMHSSPQHSTPTKTK